MLVRWVSRRWLKDGGAESDAEEGWDAMVSALEAFASLVCQRSSAQVFPWGSSLALS